MRLLQNIYLKQNIGKLHATCPALTWLAQLHHIHTDYREEEEETLPHTKI